MWMLGVKFDVIYQEFIYPEYEIELNEDRDLGFDEAGEKILGEFHPLDNRVLIDRSLSEANDPRRVFTCWHEVGGHAILQGDWLRSELTRLKRSDPLITTDSMLMPNVEAALERQANIFASHAVAPNWLVDFAISRSFGLSRPIRYIGPGPYSLVFHNGTSYHDVSTFNDLCMRIAYYIRGRFGGLSIESLSYRVGESKWIVDDSRPASREFSLKRRASRQRQTIAAS
jgi:hypothetical protein